MSDNRHLVVAASIALVPALGFGVFRFRYDWASLASDVIGAVFLLIVIGAMLRHVFSRTRVTPYTVMGAVSVFLLLGVLWQQFYQLADVISEQAFAGLSPEPRLRSTQLFYFSYVTLTTLGYGDVTPALPETMSLAAAEAIVGQCYLVVLVAYLVARLVSERSNAEPRQ